MSTSFVPARRGPAVIGLTAVLVLALTACGDDDTSTGGAAGQADAASLTVGDVWARTSAAGQTDGAAYMVITGGDVDDRLVGVSVDASVACAAQIHETVSVDDADDGDDAMPADDSTEPGQGTDASGGGGCPDSGMGDMSGTGSTTVADEGQDGDDGDGTATTTAEDLDDDTSDVDDGGMADGMGAMTMREVESIDVPAGASVALEPGGYHVMLLGLDAPLEAGDTFAIELDFEEAGTRTVTAEVRDR